jgi:hypothetical protein
VTDPIELRVLHALVAGDRTADQAAARLGVAPEVVGPALVWAVSQGYAERVELPGGAAYLPTPRGLQTAALRQEITDAVRPDGGLDLAALAEAAMEGWQGAQRAATEEALRAQASWPADDAARDRLTSGLADAYAAGALTKDELDARTGRALAATTMGELRSAGRDVVSLPPVLPRGVHRLPASPGAERQVWVNPALRTPTPWIAAAVLVVLVLVLVAL